MKRLKRIISCALICLVFATGYPMMVHANQWGVTPSKTNYYVEFDGSMDIFLCNRKSIGTEIGTEYFLTYTVESLDADTINQTGVIGTNVPTQVYPYVESEAGGGIYTYTASNRMLIEGYTYFLKFVITKDGYRCRVAWAEDEEDKSKYIEFDQTYGDVKSNLGYFGAFFGATDIRGRLTKVRCYDKKGNDLGVQVTPGRNGVVGLERASNPDVQVDHTYDITLTDCPKIAISNKRKATGDRIYMEYTVAKASSTVYQAGVISSDAPQAGYPYLDGYMSFDQYEVDALEKNGPLLEAGAKYLITYQKQADSFDVTVEKTTDGKTTLVGFQKIYGTYKDSYWFRSLWLCGFPDKDGYLNAKLTDFKCYDSNGNNLGVQVNDSTNCEVVHYGEREDYAGCEAIYYCDEDATFYALFGDQSLKYEEDNKSMDGTYRIDKYDMKVKIGKDTKQYYYLYRYFTDINDKRYRRLNTCRLTFETGKGSSVETQILNADNGYMAMKPSEPMLEGKTFVGWYTSDNQEFDFDKMVTNSQTVYAKWDKATYVSKDDGNILDLKAIGYGLGTIAVLAVAGVVAGMMVKRGKKNGSKKETDK